MVDYKLYSIFQTNSHYNNQGQRFVYKQHPKLGNLTRPRLLELYNQRCSNASEKVSLSTIRRKVTLFKSIGLLSEGTVTDMFGKEVRAYILFEDFDFFQYIPLETLMYLADTSTSAVIKLYAVLLNKFLWKKKTGETYIFTLAELATKIGLQDNNNGNTRIIKNCLNSLASAELINFVEFYTKTEEGRPSPRRRLTNVSFTHKKKIK